MQTKEESTASNKELYEKLEQQNQALRKLMESIDKKMKVDINSAKEKKKK
jgi:hypothetical protein